MITYNYECKDCGHKFEARQSIRDDSLKKCPKCKNPTLIRLISGGSAGWVKGTSTPVRM
jgi:putative FmdB family regulatory protein